MPFQPDSSCLSGKKERNAFPAISSHALENVRDEEVLTKYADGEKIWKEELMLGCSVGPGMSKALNCLLEPQEHSHRGRETPEKVLPRREGQTLGEANPLGRQWNF